MPLFLLVVGLDIFDDWQGKSLGFKNYNLDLIMLVAAYASMLFCGSMRITPLKWKRHSLKDFVAQYGKRELLFAAVRNVRVYRNMPEAEFEVAVLDSSGGGPFGLVLYQTFDRLGEKPDYAKDGGKPIAIFSGGGSQVQFGEAYAPFGSFAKA